MGGWGGGRVERAVTDNLDNNDTANVSQKFGIWVLR